MGIEGTVLDVPDSAANAATFGRPSVGPRGDGAFPQGHKLTLIPRPLGVVGYSL
jgi:hypothetical protein